MTNANQTISSVFTTTPPDQASLTILISGRGTVNVNPRAKIYSTNQSITLTAIPDVGQSFLVWSGDASGVVNPLAVAMNQSKVIKANFTSPVTLSVDQAGDDLIPQGFRFTLAGDPQVPWQIQGTTNFSAWQSLGTVTNTQGRGCSLPTPVRRVSRTGFVGLRQHPERAHSSTSNT